MAVEGRTQRPVVDHEACKRCRLCRLLCPDLSITRDEQSGRIEIDYNYCKGCGICAFICPKRAISMVFEKDSP